MDKNNVMMIVIIALLVILLGIIGAMSFYLMSFFANSDGSASTFELDGEKHVPQDKQLTVSFDEAIKGLIPAPGENPHALMFKLAVGLDNSDKKQSKEIADLQALVSSRENVIKSWVSEIIYSHSHQDYVDNPDTMQTTLTKEIKERLRMEFQTNNIVDVYLSEYLYQ